MDGQADDEGAAAADGAAHLDASAQAVHVAFHDAQPEAGARGLDVLRGVAGEGPEQVGTDLGRDPRPVVLDLHYELGSAPPGDGTIARLKMAYWDDVLPRIVLATVTAYLWNVQDGLHRVVNPEDVPDPCGSQQMQDLDEGLPDPEETLQGVGSIVDQLAHLDPLAGGDGAH